MTPILRPASTHITYGKVTIPVEIKYRAGDRLTIHVNPDRSVTAIVPQDQPWERVAVRLRARAGWIRRQQRYFEQFLPTPVARKFVSGESLYYMGRQYRLKVEKAQESSTRLRGPFLVVHTAEPKVSDRVGKAVQRWYRDRAEDVLPRRVDETVTLTRTLGLPPPDVRLRVMKTRWGSCTGSGTILLHPGLIIAPRLCIDYVIVHELCHRKVLRHDAKFYQLLGRYLPDWELRKARLDRFTIPWHAF